MTNPASDISPVFCAVDTTDLSDAAALAGKLAGAVGGLKLGKEFFTCFGPDGVRQMTGASELPLFLDLKFHDIPNTVAGAVRAACAMSPYLMTIHASGSAAMIAAAAEAATAGAAEAGVTRPNILAVTVLTSMDQADLKSVGVNDAPSDQVRRLAALAQTNGADGIVCSPLEIETLRADLGPEFLLVVPGIRPAGSAAGDQKRIMTPADAMALGASHLVIGRPITQAADPAAAALAIAADIADTGQN